MRKLLITIAMIFSLNSCAGLMLPRISTEKKGIDKAFVPFITSYKQLIGINKYKKRFNNLSMNFSKLKNGIIGRCWWLLDGNLEIEIDKEYWDFSSPTDQKFLAYHELEHCIRSRLHTNRKYKIENVLDFFDEIGHYLGIIKKKEYLEDGCPASLMHSHTMSWSCRVKHYHYYMDEIRDYKK